QVGLLRVGVDKILRLRIAEGLEGDRKECGWVEVILVDEQVSIGRIEALLAGLVTRDRRQARTGGENALEDIGCVQAARAGRNPGIARGATREQQLSASGTVGCVTEKVEAEQRVIVKNAIGSSQHALAVTAGVPRDTDARLDIVCVGLNTLLQP